MCDVQSTVEEDDIPGKGHDNLLQIARPAGGSFYNHLAATSSLIIR
jgi:hypothetical protein